MQIKQPRTTEQVVLAVPMSLERACAVEWQVLREPHKGMRGSLGKLFEDHILDLGDLGWIATHAYDANAKAAALTLLAHQIGRPQTMETTLRYGPEVITGSKYLEDKQSESEIQATFYLSIGFAAGLVLIIDFLWRAGEKIISGMPWLAVIIAMVIALFIILTPMAIYIGSKVRDEVAKVRNFRLGREGEEWVEDKVRALLDSRWIVFHNLNLPKHKEDIDFVLVGPSGVWVLEVKAYNFTIRVREGKWEWLKGTRWQRLDSDPIAQVRANAVALRYYLEQYGVMLRVNAAVVLTLPQQISNFQPTREPVWQHYEVDDRICAMNALPSAIVDADKERILSALKKVTANSNQK